MFNWCCIKKKDSVLRKKESTAPLAPHKVLSTTRSTQLEVSNAIGKEHALGDYWGHHLFVMYLPRKYSSK